jgi:hypothetical protein
MLAKLLAATLLVALSSCMSDPNPCTADEWLINPRCH